MTKVFKGPNYNTILIKLFAAWSRKVQYEMTPYMLTVLHCKLCSSLIKVTQKNIA